MKKIPDDPRFHYVDYAHTDLRTTFARVRRQMATEQQAKQAQAAVDAAKVQPIRRGK